MAHVEDDGSEMYEEETVVEEEEVIDESKCSNPIFTNQGGGGGLVTLDENEVIEIEEEFYEEIIIEDDDDDDDADQGIDSNDLDFDDADDESSAWVDDGRDYTKDPHIAPLIISNEDHFASEDAKDEGGTGDDDDEYYLNLPDIDEVSSLEDNLSEVGEESSDASFVLEEVYEEDLKGAGPTVLSSQSAHPGVVLDKLNQSADWGETSLEFDQPSKRPTHEEADFLLLSGRMDPRYEKHVAEQEITTKVSTSSSGLASHKGSSSYFECLGKDPIFVGRHKELNTMSDALNKCGNITEKNPKRCIWICGKGGIGKTSLAEYFIREHVLHREESDSIDSGDGGTFPVIAVHGSFPERALAHKPFSGLIDSLDELMSKLINEDTPGGISWRDLLREGLGKDTILLAKLIPRSKQLFELKDTSPGEKPTSETAFDVVSSRQFHRVRFILRRFFRILCEHRKVVMMLDDLHWADDDSMALIESVLSTHALANLLFVGCHRGVKPTHSLSRMKDKLSALCLADINMKPLGRRDVDVLVPRLLSSSLGENPADQAAMTELSSWLCEKAQGDPLQLQQLLAFLVETKKIVADAKGLLEWNLADLKTATYSLMTTQVIIHERMLQMPVAARLTAKSAAFLGVKVFDLRILHDVVQICATVDKKKGNACHIKDIVSLNHQVEILLDRGIFASIGPERYSFSHDLFAKASLDLLPKAKSVKETMHFEFASYQEANLSAKFGDEHIAMMAMVMDHYNLYSMKKTGDTDIERERFLKMHLRLSEDAMGKAAFATAVQRLETGLLLINQEKKWTDSYQACLNFHLQMSRVKFCQGKYDASKRFALTVVSKSKHPRDSIGALDLLIDLAIVTNNIEDAYQVALKGLMDIFGEKLGGDVESEVASMRELVQSKSDADLSFMPQIQHKKSATKLHFFTRLAEISWMKQDWLSQDLAALKMMEITLRYGASRSTSFALALYGICLGRRNLHKEAFRFGYLGAMTADETSKLGSQVIAVHHHSIAYWQRPFQASHNALRRTIGVAFDSNDMENLSFRVGAFLSLSLATGYRLDSCDETFKKFKEHAIAFHARDTWLATIPFRLLLLLRDESINPTEKGFQKYTNARATQYSIFFQMVHSVIMQDMALAEKLSVRLFHKPEGVWLPLRGFYEGLMATSLARDSTGKTRTKHQRKAAKIVAVLGAWAKTGMKQAYHMAFFLNCELRMLSGSNISIAQSCAMYDSVITATKKAGFLHHEAMANERAGAMLYLRHEDELATRYLTAAFQLYQRWGARAKLRAMKKKFPRHLDLPPEQLDARNTATSTQYASKAFAGSLDFGASQILHFDPCEIGPSTTRRRGQGRGNKGIGRGSTLPGRGTSGALATGKKDGTNRSWSDMLPSLSPDPGKKDDAVEVEAPDLSKNSPRNVRKKNKVDKSETDRAKSPPKERGIVRHLSWNKKKKSKDLDSTQRSVDSLPSGGHIEDRKERKVPLLRLVKGLSWTKRNKKDTKPEVDVDDSSSDSSEDEALKKYFKQKGALSNSEVIEWDSDNSDEDEAPSPPSSLSTGLNMGQKSKVRRKLKGSRKQPGDDTASVGDAQERKARSLSSGLDAHTNGTKSRSRSRSADPSKRKKKDSETESLRTPKDVGEKPKRRKSKTIALDATDICDRELKTIGKTLPQAQQSRSGSPIKSSPTKDAGIISKARKSVSKKVARTSIQEEGSNIQRNSSSITKESNHEATILVAAMVPDANTTKVKNTRSRSKSKTRSKSRDREGKRKESVERQSRSLSKSRRGTREGHVTDSPSGDHKKDKGRRQSSRSRSRSRNGKDERKGSKTKKAGKKSDILASTIADHNAATSPDAIALGSTGEAEIDNPAKKKRPGLLYKVRRSLSKRNIDDSDTG